MSIKFPPCNSGAGNNCADFMGAWHFLALSAGKPPWPIKFLLLGGGGCWGFLEGGVEVPIFQNIYRLGYYSGKSEESGAHKRGLRKPQIFRENRAKSLPGKSGLFGPDWSLFRAYRGLFGADWDRFLRTSQPQGGNKNSPERAFLGPIGAFWAKPPFAKPPFGFPQNC